MRYIISDATMSTFSVFFLQSSSFLAHQRIFDDHKGRNNFRTISNSSNSVLFQCRSNEPQHCSIRIVFAMIWRIVCELHRDLICCNTIYQTFDKLCSSAVIIRFVVHI